MFVMKAAPVAALRSKWEPFGPPGTCRLPGCFPEPPEAVASASVSARVQMIISSLQQGVSQEPPATLRSHRAERGREPRPAGRPSAHRGQPLLAATSPQEPSALDSDSDDSVDRDIEQAIQEYLRAKGGAGGRYRAQPARPSTQAPPKLTANPGGQTGEEGSEAQGSASPVSVSSDDSFEQGIRAEIERFLSEKKLQEAPRWVRPEEQGAEPSEAPARATPKPGREPPAKAVPRQDPTAASKEFVFRKPPRWAKVNGQPRSLRAKGTAAPEARLPAPRPEAAPHRGSSGQRPPRTQSVAAAQRASDSSSDDGIEEAIQLYQLEKSRREAGTGLAVDSARSALAEAPRRTPARKKPGFGKATDSPSPDAEQPAKLPKAGKAVPAPGEPAARSQAAGRPCGRTDVPTELLPGPAEPILPGPAEPGSAPCPPPPAEPSHPDGDGSAVDSDDSIEQEIRSFLALRMQAGHPLARAESGLQPTQGPPSQPLPSKSQDRSPHCRRRRGPGCGTTRPLASRKAREMKDGGQGRAHPALQPPGETCRQPVPARAAGLGDAHGPQGHEKAEEKESSEDKSSSLDSDEDLDTAIKDLLRSKRKARRRGRDPRASGQKKVRFGTAETQSWDKLGSARSGRRESPQVLRSCLSPCRRDCTAGPPRRAPGADRGTPDAAVPGEGTLPATRLRSRAPRGSPRVCEAEPRDRPRPDAGPRTSSDDTSSVDSDDSIELEIRKFLAEKAKESSSVGSAEAQGGEPGAPAPQPGMCTRSRRARAALPAAGVQSAATLLAQGGKGTPFAELAATLAGCEPAAPRLTGGVVTAKACPGGRNSAYRDQSPRGAEPAAADTCQTPKAPTFPGNLGSQGLLSPSPGPQADLTLPWSDFGRPGRLPSPWPLNSEGRGPAWTAGLRTESEKGAEGSARGSTSLALDPGKSLAFGGFSPLLSTQLFQFGRGVSWGKHAGLFSTQLGLPPHSPPFAAFGAAQAGPSPVFGGPHLLLRKEGGSWPGRRPPAGLSSHDGRSMDLRYRREAVDADGKDQEALGSDASEGSDVSVEGGVG